MLSADGCGCFQGRAHTCPASGARNSTKPRVLGMLTIQCVQCLTMDNWISRRRDAVIENYRWRGTRAAYLNTLCGAITSAMAPVGSLTDKPRFPVMSNRTKTMNRMHLIKSIVAGAAALSMLGGVGAAKADSY